MLCRQIRDVLRKELKRMYGNAECAYNAIDFSGLGFITKDAFLNSIVVKQKVHFSMEEFQTFFNGYNMFTENEGGISLDTFKKIFFPQLYLVQEDKDDIDDIKANEMRNALDTKKDEQP